MPLVSKEKFEFVVKELHDNGDFFDPMMLDEFTEADQHGGRPRPTTLEEVRNDYMSGPFQQFDQPGQMNVNDYELYEVIHFLESYSDVNLYEPKRDRGERSLDQITTDWYEMYQGEYHAWVSDSADFLFQVGLRKQADEKIATIAEIINDYQEKRRSSEATIERIEEALK